MRGREVMWAARFKPRLSGSLVIAFNPFPSWAYHWPARWERWGCLAISRCYPSLPLCSTVQSVWYVEVPWASLSFITRTRVGPGSLLMDVSFGLCLTVIHSKAMSGCSWGLGCLTLSPDSLSVLSHALGWQSKPTLWMTSQPRNPLELRRGKLDSGKTQATIRLMRVWASSHGHWGPGPGVGDGDSKHGDGDSKHALSTHFVGACLQSCSPHSNPMGMLIISPILQQGKLRCMDAVPGVKAS